MNYIIEYITIVVRLLVLLFIIIMQILSILIPATTRCTDFSYYSILDNEYAMHGMEYTSFDDDYPELRLRQGCSSRWGHSRHLPVVEGWIVW